jgi:hypothetical protein
MISSQSAVLAGFLMFLLEGCTANPSTTALAGLPTMATFYECNPSDGSANASDARSVEIDPGAEEDEIILKIGSGHAQRLEADATGARGLFANAAYAWRLTSPQPVLTIIGSFQTYRCTPR